MHISAARRRGRRSPGRAEDQAALVRIFYLISYYVSDLGSPHLQGRLTDPASSGLRDSNPRTCRVGQPTLQVRGFESRSPELAGSVNRPCMELAGAVDRPCKLDSTIINQVAHVRRLTQILPASQKTWLVRRKRARGTISGLLCIDQEQNCMFASPPGGVFPRWRWLRK